MKVTLTNGNCSLTEDFPKKPLELLDILDRLHQTGNRTVGFEFDCYYEEITPPSELTEKMFTADIFALNVFAERLVNMTSPERAVYQAVVQKNPVFRFEDAVQMTFGLESVPVIRASNFSELGEFVIENDMIPEVQECPNELVQFLDRAKIGRLMAEQYNGVFVGDYYCEPENYEKPDILIEFGEPKPHIFRFLLTPDANRPELAEWTSLPCNDSLLENKICLDYQSALPKLRISQRPTLEELLALNRTSNFLIGLNPQELVKLKAVMEYTGVRNIAGVLECCRYLSEYDFDSAPQNKSEYGLKFLKKFLSADVCELFKNSDLTDLGSEILHHKHGRMTSYGVLSGKGQTLYSEIIAEQEQTESEDETEDCEMKIGGM